jgi:hypothetical protein
LFFLAGRIASCFQHLSSVPTPKRSFIISLFFVFIFYYLSLFLLVFIFYYLNLDCVCLNMATLVPSEMLYHSSLALC